MLPYCSSSSSVKNTIRHGYAEIFIEIENRGEKTDIVVYCDGIKRTQICFEAIGEKEIREVYNCLIVFLTEDEDEYFRISVKNIFFIFFHSTDN